ncbi:MAG: Glu-tRNA(Gln) amidotransferase subunit GatD [Candidatus Aenigmarchaeota archaeon]|nr:Glu-tRNA(Gln) amidotransferase subunit GatD [Candidatus Aenigmarchaeota archaeon]
MYSRAVERVLKAKKIKIGDHVILLKNGKKYKGVLLPKPDFGDPDTLLIKLDNGYNTGFRIKNIEIKNLRTKEPENVEKEVEYEFGKIGKRFLNVKFNPKKPKVSLISTGGTISSRIDYRTGGVYALEKPEEILHNIPELADIVNLHMMSPFNKMSEDMQPEDWIEIAKTIAKELNSGKKGVILTHGTDTLHYTSAALSFFLRNLRKPVVFVGSQRSSDRGSSDAAMNLVCASHIAVSNIAEVGICMHGATDDKYCLFIRGTKARKMHSTRRDAFRPINEKPLAKAWQDGTIEILNNNFKTRNDNEKVKLDTRFEKKVALLKVYPGSDPDVIDFYIGKKYRGFVVEGTGMGHVPTFAKKSWVEKIKKHTKDGIPFVITTQTIYGRVNPYVYTNLRKLFLDAGAISGEDMLSETAYVKLGWVLGHTKDIKKVKELILTNFAGEITSRTETETFLI